jgi:hypothetical protein
MPSTALRAGVYDRGSPPPPPRLRRNVGRQLVMADNDGVRDVSAIQTPPPTEIQLTAPVQNVHKMIADHPALTSLASHGCFLLMLYLVSLPRQVLSVVEPCPVATPQ